MGKYLIKSLSWISLLFFILQGCALTDYKRTSGSTPGIIRPAFADTFSRGLYKTNISVRGHEFGGLMLIKRVSGEHFRISFFNELGMSFLDGDFQKDSSGAPVLQIQKIYGPLNRKALISALQESFRLIFQPENEVQDFPLYQNKKNHSFLAEYAGLKSRKYYIGFEEKARPFIARSVSSCNMPKARASFLYSEKYPGSPSEIDIHHKGSGLNIIMKRIE